MIEALKRFQELEKQHSYLHNVINNPDFIKADPANFHNLIEFMGWNIEQPLDINFKDIKTKKYELEKEMLDCIAIVGKEDTEAMIEYIKVNSTLPNEEAQSILKEMPYEELKKTMYMQHNAAYIFWGLEEEIWGA